MASRKVRKDHQKLGSSEFLSGSEKGALSKRAQVSIYGRQYFLKGVSDERRAQEAARCVDVKMKAIAAAAGETTPARLAILAALNIADEFLQSAKKLIGDIEEQLGNKTLFL